MNMPRPAGAKHRTVTAVCGGWRISEIAMPCQADFLDFLFSFDKLLPSTSEWLAAGEAEAGSAGEQPAEE